MGMQRLDAEQIFNAARAKADPKERAGYLDGACGKDVGLRAKVEALLRADAEAGSFLASVEVDPDATMPQTGRGARVGHSRSAPAEQSGQMIGRYKLLQLIGEGGFGSVWLAEQREPVKRRVALKIIKLGMDTKQVIARFEAERQALAMMDHPNIAKVLDAGATETGRPFFVMELVKGVPILEYCDTEKLEMRARLGLFTSTCHAIQHAHQKGIIHRDIKPSNVLVTLHDGVPVPKVIDFGIAKATNTELTTKTLFTEHRQMIGTPAYMSPEQAEMSGLDIDTRSDIYSLGVLLYELLTGTTPFDSKELLSKGYAEMVRIIREIEPHKPSTRLSTLGETASRTAELRRVDVKRLSLVLRGDLDWIVMKCLEKDRSRRYETANGLAADIKRHLGDEPVIAGPPSRSYRLRKFVRRNRGQVIAGGVVAAALVLGVIGTTWGMLWAQDERARVSAQAERASEALRQVTDEFAESVLADATEATAVPIVNPSEGGEVEALARTAVNLVRSLDASKAEAQRQAEIAEAVNDFLNDDLLAAVAPSVKAGRGRDVLMREVLDEAAKRIEDASAPDGRFADKPLVEASIRATLGMTYMLLGEYPAAELHLERARLVRHRELGEEHPDTLDSMHSLAFLFFKQGRHGESERLNIKTLNTRKRVRGEEHPDTLASMSNLALLYQNQGRYQEAESLHVKTLAIEKRVLGEDHKSTLGSMANLGLLYWKQGRYAEAEALLLKTLPIMKRVLGDEHDFTLACMGNLAITYGHQDLQTKAELLHLEILEIQKQKLGEEHSTTLGSMINLAVIYSNQGRYSEAEQLYLTVLDVYERGPGEEHPRSLTAMGNLAVVYKNQGRYDEAETLYLKTLDIKKRVLGEESPDTLGTISSLGFFYNDRGRYDDARAMLETSLPIKRQVLGMGHPWTGYAMNGLAQAYVGLGRREDALPLYRELIDLELAAADDPDATAMTLNDAAWTLLTHDFEELHDPSRALGFAERACSKEQEAGGGNLWLYLDTLALAQHGTGDTTKAIETQKRAISLIPDGANEATVTEVKTNLRTYEAALAEPSGDDSEADDGGAR